MSDERGSVSHPRIWTVEEANSLVPRLSFLIGQQLATAAEIERCWRRLVELVDAGAPAVALAGGQRAAAAAARARPEQTLARARSGSPEARAAEQELTQRISAYETGWRQVEELGVSVKDQQTGLCDFYGRVEGRLVCLCWRYGEEGVRYYHEIDAGFAGRKPLTSDVRQRLLN